MVARENQIRRIEGEVMTSLCIDCKCCLAQEGHCWNCHSTISVEKLCGCGNCLAMVSDYIERTNVMMAAYRNKKMAKSA